MRKLVLLLVVGCAFALPATPDSSDTPIAAQSNVIDEPEGPLDLSELLSSAVVVTVDQSKCLHMCSGRGHCVVNNSPAAPPANTTICICNQGWTGPDCSQIMLPVELRKDGSMDCPNHCSSHGVCYRGSSVVRPRCYCDSLYTGADCSKLRDRYIVCPNNCSGFGVCTEGYSHKMDSVMAKCLCDSNHVGDDCSVEIKSPCPRGCSGKGECTRKGCKCDAGFMGADCSLLELPTCEKLKNCSSRGRCLNGACYCFAGYGGRDCSKEFHPECPMECNGHGRCVLSTPYFPGGCICEEGWLAPDCKKQKIVHKIECEKNCSDHGECRPDGTCDCHLGWTGPFCDFPAKLPQGELVGPKFNGEPVIHPYFMDGKSIVPSPDDRAQFVVSDEHPKCPNSCSSHGVCLQILSSKSATFRSDGTSLPDDMISQDPQPTLQFVCKCDPGYVGEDCSFAPPPNAGIFPMGRVEIAKAPTAPAVAPGQPARLFMEDNTSWNRLPTMDQIKIKEMGCPNNCSSRGRCIRNKNGFPVCSCYPGWLGNDCGEKAPSDFACPKDCSKHGRCVAANQYFPVRCLCEPGYYGDACEFQRQEKVVFEVEDGFCLNHCSGRGPCVNGKCICMEMGWGGPDCSVQAGGTCEANCHGNGICFWGTCDCLGGYSGVLCDKEPSAPCPNKCGMRGKCVGGTCVCLSGFTGDDCSDVMLECPNHCSGHGECHPSKPSEMIPATCECADGWTGNDCSNFPQNIQIPVAEPEPTLSQRIAAQEQQKEEKKQEKRGVFSVKPAL